MTLEALAAITIQFDGHAIHFEPGAVFTVTENQARRLLERARGKVRRITLPADPVALNGPVPPLQPGWLVAYRDQRGMLCGGCDDREQGTVRACLWNGSAWTVLLTTGTPMPLRAVVSVAKTDAADQIVAAWTVREHGYDGERGP